MICYSMPLMIVWKGYSFAYYVDKEIKFTESK